MSDAPAAASTDAASTDAASTDAASTDREQPGDGGEPSAPASASPRSLRVLSALLLVATLALLATTVAFAASRSSLQRERNDRRAAEEVAGRFGTRLLTYDYTQLDKLEQSVLQLSAGRFKTDFQQKFGALEQVITAVKSRSVATVKHVYLEDVDNDQVRAVVVVDQVTEGVTGRHARSDIFAELSLVKLKGHWLVDDYGPLSTGDTLGATGANPAPTTTPTTTPTTAPAPATTPPGSPSSVPGK